MNERIICHVWCGERGHGPVATESAHPALSLVRVCECANVKITCFPSLLLFGIVHPVKIDAPLLHPDYCCIRL